MGYYARGAGDLTLREISKDIEKCLDEVFEWDQYGGGNPGEIQVAVWASDKYYDDFTRETLDALAPYVIAGNIRYIGEDDSMWEFWFDKESGSWKDGNAEVLWPSDVGRDLPAGYYMYDIDWDTDNEDVDLPREAAVLTADLVGMYKQLKGEEKSTIEELLLEYLSDAYGFLVKGFKTNEIRRKQV